MQQTLTALCCALYGLWGASLPQTARRLEQAPRRQADLLKERGIPFQPVKIPKIQTKIMSQLHSDEPSGIQKKKKKSLIKQLPGQMVGDKH